MRGYLSKGFSRGSTIQDPFYTPPNTETRAAHLAEAQAEADTAKDLEQPAASKLQDQADALREDLESKGDTMTDEDMREGLPDSELAIMDYEDALDHDGE